jgi:hypothetical protein
VSSKIENKLDKVRGAFKALLAAGDDESLRKAAWLIQVLDDYAVRGDAGGSLLHKRGGKGVDAALAVLGAAYHRLLAEETSDGISKAAHIDGVLTNLLAKDLPVASAVAPTPTPSAAQPVQKVMEPEPQTLGSYLLRGVRR